MITTTLCDDGRHGECPGTGLVNGEHAPARGESLGPVWVRVKCECACHVPDAAGRLYGIPPSPTRCTCGTYPDPGTKPNGGCWCVEDKKHRQDVPPDGGIRGSTGSV